MVKEGRAQYADPCSMLRASVMLLSHIGYQAQADKLTAALDKCMFTEKALTVTAAIPAAPAPSSAITVCAPSRPFNLDEKKLVKTMAAQNQNKVSLPVIKRLPKYYRYISDMHNNGIVKVSSSELARMMGTTASQVRQDFNCFGGFGQQGIGYHVDVLLSEISKLLFSEKNLNACSSVQAVWPRHIRLSFRRGPGLSPDGRSDKSPDEIGRELRAA